MLRVSLWKLKALGWIGILFFSFCMIMSLLTDQVRVAPLFMPFILLSLPVLLQAGTIEATTKTLRLIIPLGDYELLWKDVESVEAGQSFIVFITDSGRLNIPVGSWWSGDDKKALSDMIGNIVSENSLPVSRTFLGDFKFPSNTLKKG